MFHGNKALDARKKHKRINHLIANQRREKLPVKHFGAPERPHRTAHLPQHEREEVSATLLYVGLLGRTLDQGGYAHWTNAVNSSQGDALGAMEAFVQSQEYYDRFLPGEEVGAAALVGLASTPTAAALTDGIG